MVLLALLNLAAFFTAGVLVAEVTSTAGTEVLVRSADCGNWTIDDPKLVYAFTTKTLNDTISAATYARACYGGTTSAAECNQYKVDALPYSISEKESCPFSKGMCLEKSPVVSFDTGNLSSHDHFGINAQNKDRIIYRRKTTCAPIIDMGYVVGYNYTDAVNASLGFFRGSDGDIVDFYNFGGTVYINGSKNTNFTFAYNRRFADLGTSYDLA